MGHEAGDNTQQAPVERPQVGESALQAQVQSSQADGAMANFSAQRNMESAQASKTMAENGTLGNLNITDAGAKGGVEGKSDANLSSPQNSDRTSPGQYGQGRDSFSKDTPQDLSKPTPGDGHSKSASEGMKQGEKSESQFASPKNSDSTSPSQYGQGRDPFSKDTPQDLGKPTPRDDGRNKSNPESVQADGPKDKMPKNENTPRDKDFSPNQAAPGGGESQGARAESQINKNGSAKAENSAPSKPTPSDRLYEQPAPRQQPAPLVRPNW